MVQLLKRLGYIAYHPYPPEVCPLRPITNTISLQNDTIALQCRKINERLSALRTDKSDRVYIDLSLEELLLALQSVYSPQTEVAVIFSRYHTRCTIRVDLPGEPCNILKDALKGLGYDKIILPVLNQQIVYTFSEGCNHYDFQISVHPKISFAMSMVISMAAAAVCGMLGRFFLPADLMEGFRSLLSSVSGIILNLMRLLVVPLVFCGMINGITGCGNLRRLRKISSGLLLCFLLCMFSALILTTSLSFAIFPLKFSAASEGISVFQSFLDIVASLFPDNLITPFQNGDCVQIILLASFAGVILLMIGDQSARITTTFHRLYDALMVALALINRLIPLLIFALVTNLFCDSSFTYGALLLRALALEFALAIVWIAAEIILTARKTGRSCKRVLRSVWPITLKGFLTASAISVFPETEQALQDEFGLSREKSAFGISFATGIFGIANAVCLPLVTIFGAHVAGIDVSAGWMFSLIVQCFVYSLAIPSSTGGLLFVLSALYTAFGIPMEYLTIGTPLLMLVDYPASSLRATVTFLEIAREYTKKNSRQ